MLFDGLAAQTHLDANRAAGCLDRLEPALEGRALDAVCYGPSSTAPPEGWAGDPVPCGSKMPWGRLLLRGPGSDTGTAADWAWPEEPMCGWLEPSEPLAWEGAYVSCFVTPDEGLQAVCSAVRGGPFAQRRRRTRWSWNPAA